MYVLARAQAAQQAQANTAGTHADAGQSVHTSGQPVLPHLLQSPAEGWHLPGWLNWRQALTLGTSERDFEFNKCKTSEREVWHLPGWLQLRQALNPGPGSMDWPYWGLVLHVACWAALGLVEDRFVHSRARKGLAWQR